MRRRGSNFIDWVTFLDDRLRGGGHISATDDKSLRAIWEAINQQRSTSLEFKSEPFDLIQVNSELVDTTIVVKEANRVKEIIKDIYSNHSLILEIPPRKFEEIIAELLRSQGFKADVTKQTRDNGYDIIAVKRVEGFPVKFLVECKRYTEKPVGVDIIRGFNNVISTQNANKGIIVTTSYFTRDAKKEQERTPYLLDFRDKDDVINWVRGYMNKI